MREEDADTLNFGWTLIILVIIAALVPIVITFDVANSVLGNAYEAIYTILYLFLGATGVDPFFQFNIALPLFSHSFDIMTSLIIVDGLIRIVVIGFVIGVIVQMLSSIDIRSRLGLIRTKRLSGHTIIAGYSPLAEDLCKSMNEKGREFVVIDNNPEDIETLMSLRYRTINGNFTHRDDLENAMVGTADSIVFTSKNDYENLLGVVTARFMNSKIKIVSRATLEASVTKMHKAGAPLCVVPEILAGVDIGECLANIGYVNVAKRNSANM